MQNTLFNGCYVKNCKCSFDLEIKESKIPEAGLGVFATTSITCRGWVEYIGKYTTDVPTDGKYAWEIAAWDEDDGEPYRGGLRTGCVDAKDCTHWTKYVNCAMTVEEANLEKWQKYNRVYYSPLRDIDKGEELLVYYGDSYVQWIKQKRYLFPVQVD